ncbi:MAG: DegT/DnrJ/EryC1/StrS family aminotransferase [Vicinamibacterales bacterium]
MNVIVPFVDLKAQHASIRDDVRAAIDGVLDNTDFILGEAVRRFEAEVARYFGVAHAVGVGSGFDALRLTLEALGVGSGDEVIVPANTYIATALAVSAVGASPVLVDCRPDTFNIDPSLLRAAVTSRTRAIMPVHLYGQSADMAEVEKFSQEYGLQLIEDTAQAHGARFEGRLCGTLGRAGCFSFYPSKNLGAIGDGGLVITRDEALAERIRLLRNYGQRQRNEHAVIGGSSRLDTLQAAVLSVKLPHLDRWNAARASHAERYRHRLARTDVVLPGRDPRSTHIYHLFVIRTRDRDALRDHLSARGIQTGIHYPQPIHLTPAYRHLNRLAGTLPETERASREILSLPMFAELTDAQIDFVADEVRAFLMR